MKNFVTNEGVVNAFINGLSTEGRNTNQSIFFRNDTIFSYGSHYPMAKKVGNTVLVNDTKYSNTTSKQVRILLNSLVKTRFISISVKNPLGTIEENVAYFEEKIAELTAKMAKSRVYKDYYLQCIEEIKEFKTIYLELMGAN